MERTTDSILEAIERAVSERQSWSPSMWIEAAVDLVSLMGVEQAKLYNRKQEVAKEMARLRESGETVASAKLKVESMDLYWEAKKQEGKIERIIELVRLSKHMARMANDELHS